MCVVLKKITQIWMELKLQMGFKRDLNTTEIKRNNDKTHGNVFETLFVSMRICLVN